MSTYHGIALPQCDIRYLPGRNFFMIVNDKGDVVDEWVPETAKAVMKFLGASLADIKQRESEKAEQSRNL